MTPSLNLRTLDPAEMPILNADVKLKDGTKASIRFATINRDLDAIFDLHKKVASEHTTDCYIYQKSRQALADLMQRKGRTLILTCKKTGKIIAKKCINLHPTSEDLPLLDRDKMTQPISIGADTTAPDYQGRGAMKALSHATMELLSQCTDVRDVVAVVTLGNSSSLAQYLRNDAHFQVRAVGVDTCDNSTILACHRNFSKEVSIQSHGQIYLPDAMKRVTQMQTLLTQGMVAYKMDHGGIHFGRPKEIIASVRAAARTETRQSAVLRMNPLARGTGTDGK